MRFHRFAMAWRRLFTPWIPLDALKLYVKDSDVVERLVLEARKVGWGAEDEIELYPAEYERAYEALQWSCHRACIPNVNELDRVCVAHYNIALKYFRAVISNFRCRCITGPVGVTDMTVFVSHVDCFSPRLLANRPYVDKIAAREAFLIAMQVQTASV